MPPPAPPSASACKTHAGKKASRLSKAEQDAATHHGLLELLLLGELLHLLLARLLLLHALDGRGVRRRHRVLFAPAQPGEVLQGVAAQRLPRLILLLLLHRLEHVKERAVVRDRRRLRVDGRRQLGGALRRGLRSDLDVDLERRRRRGRGGGGGVNLHRRLVNGARVLGEVGERLERRVRGLGQRTADTTACREHALEPELQLGGLATGLGAVGLGAGLHLAVAHALEAVGGEGHGGGGHSCWCWCWWQRRSFQKYPLELPSSYAVLDLYA